jgi:cellulose synthase/poly-beta-1,6-N-acetylglucosamine synthase-like glycosyltransferase
LIVLQYVLAALVLIAWVPCLVLLVQVLAALPPPSQGGPQSAVPQPDKPATVEPVQVCLLMPAHNEAGGIGPVLQALLPQLNQYTRLLVVADNCTDNTADLVRAVAAAAEGKLEVIERHNTALRGKGFALDHGVQHLADSPPDVVLVVDADCTLMPGSIATLAQQCVGSQRPIQALYLMQSPPGASPKTKLAEFAWVVKNQVRPLGYHRLGLPCQLMGTGMAFTWAQIRSAKLNTGHIAEDMQLGVELAQAGGPPQFCPQALVTSYFPTAADGISAQRTRWEHGHLGVIVSELPRLLRVAITSRNPQLLAMALDLCVPPLALLTLMVGGLLAASAATGTLPLMLSMVAFATLGLAVLLSWLRFGRHVISFRQLSSLPWYVLAKVPLYFYFLAKRQTSWVRSKREGE